MRNKIIISHRGYINGPDKALENNPAHIVNLLEANPALFVEIDLWAYLGNKLFLSHDEDAAGHQVSDKFLSKYKRNLFIHCKNPAAAYYCRNFGLNYFAHDKDDFTIVSNGFLWFYPGKEKPGCNGIILDFTENVRDLSGYAGICTDNPSAYLKIKI